MSEQLTDSVPQQPLRHRLFGVIMATTVGIHGLVDVEQHVQPPSAIVSVQEKSLESQHTICTDLAADTITTVANLFDHPAPLPAPNFDTKRPHKYARGRQLHAYLLKQERDLGLTFPSYDPGHVLDLEAALNQPDQRQPFSAYLEAATSVLDQLDIPLRIGAPLRLGVDAKTPTNDELETNASKNEMINIAKMIAQQPEQLIRSIGIKGINITAHGKGFAGLAYTSKGEVVIDITNVSEQDYNVPSHELTHLIDARECGADGMYKDSAYANLNIKAKYAVNRPVSKDFLNRMPPSFDRAQSTYYRQWDAAEVALNKHNKRIYCADAARAEASISKVEMESDYSYTNVVEDKAEVGKEMFDPFSLEDMLDTHSPVRRGKMLLLLARLYVLDPSVVKNLALESAVEGAKQPDMC